MSVKLQQFADWKQQGRRITVLTAWDYAFAEILDQAGVEMILVGDSLAMVTLGHPTTLPLTLDEMIHHAKAVRRGVKNAWITVDLPFGTYQESPEQAVRSASRVLQETGANAVKLEGGYPEVAATVAKLVKVGIPVMGHVGLTPQSVQTLGFTQQGKTDAEGDRIFAEAIALEKAGAFSIVLEHIPTDLAQSITNKLAIPTIGIGAGAGCDGQVLVTTDALGLGSWKPPFAKAYANLRETITQAVQAFTDEVRSGQFPE
ncbi:3-methyl-2-oxobutanoate hydroxymethyltransferase [filamentous cyanobacterium LEGE 11480]|uniref:3-methyl-2-oxobutanoate hydroxymethyltransferase n=1 Tax=Romeriopsis navalis LEGE 11480 TaxID=2777977 RepID=A0A928VM13_9CYAN|nr:3-methyl-2-oxobutanoate hydroxymethyltransferase [Romeriopsis navalis]MBE9028837.1 3-methyl-2-oxobutanoate hydroxymethyltransferase [Romeriopsis navalis LEGE 11480]